jgi:hypothetical protein
MAAYDDNLTALVNASGKASNEITAKVLQMLSDAQKKLAGELATTEWGAHHLEELKAATAEALEEFKSKATDEVRNAYAEAWENAGSLIDGALVASGVDVSLIAAAPALSASQLELMAGYSADLISGLAQDAIKKINSEITLAILGQKTLNEVMDAIGKNLTDQGVFGSIATRAETISRTEMARVFSNAREARMKGVADLLKERNPGMKIYKMWIHSGKKRFRPRHKALHKVVVLQENNFPGWIPYPHAPGLSAKETVNCGCVHVLLFPGMKGYPDKIENKE